MTYVIGARKNGSPPNGAPFKNTTDIKQYTVYWTHIQNIGNTPIYRLFDIGIGKHIKP